VNEFVVAIVGPTASGKSELAVELASSDQVALTRNSADAVIDMKIL